MPHRRVLCLWFPRFDAEIHLRRHKNTAHTMPFGIVQQTGTQQVLYSLNTAASALGLYCGQPLRDALAMAPQLQTTRHTPSRSKQHLMALARWAGQYSPWVALSIPDGLNLDITGCAHLFGGEEALITDIQTRCLQMGLSVRCGLADTLGAAWAISRYSGQTSERPHSGDAIDQEARATRARAAKRRSWERGGTARAYEQTLQSAQSIIPIGQARKMLCDLPAAALRIEPQTVEHLSRLGLRCIGDVLEQPRTALARRFGKDLILRLDQALGSCPEPLSPLKDVPHFGVRLSFPEPIGTTPDIIAGFDKIAPTLCENLKQHGQGVRLLQVEASLTDGTLQTLKIGLAQPTHDPDKIRPLLLLKVDDIDPRFGIDMLRLVALHCEPVHSHQHSGHMHASEQARQTHVANQDAIADLVGRLGTRVGLEAITCVHPSDSHIPEKSAQIRSAAWSKLAPSWPQTPNMRPIVAWPPEALNVPPVTTPPAVFRWRNQTCTIHKAFGPERIAPEWWFDDPNWRTGQRDYWRVLCENGYMLWIYYAHGGSLSAGWFCQGSFL